MTSGFLSSRRASLAAAVAASGVVFVVFVAFERPGLGLGHFFYLPVCLAALATDAVVGAAAGLAAAGLYLVAVEATPHVVSAPLTPATAIRVCTFTAAGALVGLFAQRNRALVTRLRALAGTDFVTGVGNVRAFDEELGRRCAARRPFTLALVDVDELHRLNEVHGRNAGDAALRRVAESLAALAGEGALVARVGGDEFGVLGSTLPGLAGRVNRAVAEAGVTVTVATTAFPEDGEAADDLFRKADDRLFAAKLVRSNRATLAAV